MVTEIEINSNMKSYYLRYNFEYVYPKPEDGERVTQIQEVH